MDTVNSWLSCKICLSPFDDSRPPLLFPCGHTCCSSCLSTLLEISKICHECEAPLQHSSVDDYPKNDQLIRVTHRLRSLHLTHKLILNHLVAADYKIPEVLQMSKNKNKIHEFINQATNDQDLDATLNDFEKLMFEIANKYTCGINYKYRVHFHSSQFKNSKSFLKKIFKEVTSGTKIVAHSTFNDQERFAGVTDQGERAVYLYAFNSCWKPIDSKIVKFDDLKKAFTESKTFAFMTFPHGNGLPNLAKIIFIEPVEASILSSNVFRGFTGESECSFEGCPSFKYRNYKYYEYNKFDDKCFSADKSKKADGEDTHEVIIVNSGKQIQIDEQVQGCYRFSHGKNTIDHFVKIRPSGDIEISIGNNTDLIVVGKVVNSEYVKEVNCNFNHCTVNSCGLVSVL